MDLVVTPVKKAPRETPDQVAPPHVGAQGSSPTDGEDEQAEDVIEIDGPSGPHESAEAGDGTWQGLHKGTGKKDGRKRPQQDR